MRKTFAQRHPLLVSLLLALLTVVFMTIAGITVVSLDSKEVEMVVIQGIFIWVSGIVGLLIMKKSRYTMVDYGFVFSKQTFNKKVLWFIPILLIELLPVLYGFSSDLTVPIVLILIFFTIGVGINEEVYYRGLILKVLEEKGIKYAVIISSILFGVAHVFNALAGKDMFYISLQITFAALFGFVAALLVIITRSIMIPIIWHALHDFLAMSTAEVLDSTGLIILGAQSTILLIYAVYLWKKAFKS